jgi:NADPH2:quinone reductase
VRQVVFDSQGPPDVLQVREVDTPAPGAGQVLVRVAAAGVNAVDLYQRGGTYKVSLPFVPGFEGAGEVLEVGQDVTGVAAGDRVAWYGAPAGYATHCLVPAARLVPVPAGLDLGVATAAVVQGMTAHFLAHDVVELADGGTALVHAAAGGIGALLTQYLAARGVTVIATVSSAAKAEVARAAGATHVIDYTEVDFAEAVAEITGKAGVDVVFDGVGADTVAKGLTCLRPKGTFVLYGQASGVVSTVDAAVIKGRGSLFFTNVSLGHYDNTRDAILARAAAVFGDVLAGRLAVRVHGSFPLADAARAHKELESRSAAGKVLLLPE